MRGRNWHRNRVIEALSWLKTSTGNKPLELPGVRAVRALIQVVMWRGQLIAHLQNRLRSYRRKYATLHREIKILREANKFLLEREMSRNEAQRSRQIGAGDRG